MVDNIQQATEAITTSIERAEKSSGTRIVSAHVSIGGNHVQSLNNRGIATIPGKTRPITEEDIDRALEGARNLNLPTNREVLHSIARFFVVDGQEQVTDPVGMFGQRLDMDCHIVTGSVTASQNLTQCIEGAGIQVETIVFSPLAAAEAVLEDEEKDQGVILVDIGGGTTDIAVFVDGSVFHTTVLPIGGYHLTHDLVAGLRAPYSAVEELKLAHGACLPSRVDPDEIVEIEAFGGQRTRTVPRRKLAEILQARVEEIFDMVQIDVKRAGFDDMVAAGLVVTGGTAAPPRHHGAGRAGPAPARACGHPPPHPRPRRLAEQPRLRHQRRPAALVGHRERRPSHQRQARPQDPRRRRQPDGSRCRPSG